MHQVRPCGRAVGAGIAEEMPTRSLAAHPHQHSGSIPVPSSPRPSGGMIKGVTPSWLFLRAEGFGETIQCHISTALP